MRASVAYFAGAGTVIAAIAAGLGGGLLMANIIGPNGQKPGTTRLEQRMSPKPDQPQTAVPYLAAAPAASAPAAAPANPQPQPVAGNAATDAPRSAPPVQTSVSSDRSRKSTESRSADSKPADSASSKRENQAATQPATPDPQEAASENAYAKARDADLKRTDDKKRAERRQQWTARRQGRDQPDDQTQNQNQRGADTRGWNNKTGNDDRGQRSDDNGWKSGNWKYSDNGWNSDDSKKKSDDGARKSDDRGWKSTDRRDRGDRGWRDQGPREVIVEGDDFDRPRFFDSDRPRNFGEPMRGGFPHFNLFGPD